MTVDAGHGGGCLNFAAEIDRMPEYHWQCLDFRAQDNRSGTLAGRLWEGSHKASANCPVQVKAARVPASELGFAE
jgi:hypothetical protein